MGLPEEDIRLQQQALEWLVLLSSGEVTVEEKAAWERWCALGPRHAQAWQRVARLPGQWQDLPPVLAHRSLRHAAGPVSRRRVLQGLGLLAGCAVIGYGAQVQLEGPWPSSVGTLRTATGERRAFTLEDGSQLLLNTLSQVGLQFTGHERRIHLLGGEIQMTSAPDVPGLDRPLLVETGQGLIRALGTRFSVRQQSGITQVALFDGALEVRTVKTGQSVLLAAGQTLRFSATTVEAPQPVRPWQHAWVNGQLVAERMRLDDFLTELGRYYRGVISCDQAVAGQVVSGVFPLDDPQAILQALPEGLPVRLSYLTRYWVRVRSL